MSEAKRPTLTTAAGIPVTDSQNSLTAGPRGPLLVQDWQLFEGHAHFNRERIPERVVHAKGSGAYGSHTYSLINDKDERFWVKFHFKTMQGIECLLRSQDWFDNPDKPRLDEERTPDGS